MTFLEEIPMWADNAPNPGSDEARTLGCKCPILDNNHGLRAPWPPDNWWTAMGCPVHHVVTVTVEYAGGFDEDQGWQERGSDD